MIIITFSSENTFQLNVLQYFYIYKLYKHRNNFWIFILYVLHILV